MAIHKLTQAQVTQPVREPRRQQPAEAKAAPALSQDSFSGTSIPASYTIRQGDTLAKVAKRFRLPLGTLLTLNPHLVEGPRRRMDGSRVFPGDVVKLQAPPVEVPPPDTREADALKEKLKEAEAQKAIARAKFQLASLPKPADWRSPQEATDALAAGDKLLAQVPEADEDRPALAKLVAAAREAYEGMLKQLGALAGEPEHASKAKKAIQKLDAAHLALATPAQKAGLVRNLVRWDNADHAAEKQILAILGDAKRQGQLEETLQALHGMDRKALGILPDRRFMTYLLPRVMDDAHLDAYEQLLQGSGQKAFLEAIGREREQRAADRI